MYDGIMMVLSYSHSATFPSPVYRSSSCCKEILLVMVKYYPLLLIHDRRSHSPRSDRDAVFAA